MLRSAATASGPDGDATVLRPRADLTCTRPIELGRGRTHLGAGAGRRNPVPGTAAGRLDRLSSAPTAAGRNPELVRGRSVLSRDIIDHLGRHVLITVAALSAVACASGGGGSAPAPAPGLVSPPPPPPPPPPPGPSPTSAEFTANYALGAIHADAAFAAGASRARHHRGGIDRHGGGRIWLGTASAASRPCRSTSAPLVLANNPVGTDPHATYVAGVLASNFNGSGTVGVAYNSTVLSVRADTTTTAAAAAPAGTCISAPPGQRHRLCDRLQRQGGQHVVRRQHRSTRDRPSRRRCNGASPRDWCSSPPPATRRRRARTGRACTPPIPVSPGSSSPLRARPTAKPGALASFSNQAGVAQAAYFMTAPGVNLVTDCNASLGAARSCPGHLSFLHATGRRRPRTVAAGLPESHAETSCRPCCCRRPIRTGRDHGQ